MIVGIDLGTTNSAVAVWRDNSSHVIENALGAMLTPSAVSVDKSGQTWIGAAALDRLATHSEETATSFKRYMGSERTTKLGGKQEWKPEDLSALVLQALCNDVEAAMGERPSEAVITVPAYFNDKQRKATRRAGELAGLSVRRLINEPTAAALAFGLQDRGDREPFLVFDLGGGTFDVSIVEMFDGIIEVRASAGDHRLGGDDFNDAMVALVKPKLDQDILAKADDVQREALLQLAAEKARRTLTDKSEAEFTFAIGGESTSATVTTDEFETACAPLIERLREPVVRAMRDCHIATDELSDIVLVGGATRMPVVRKAITRMFGRFPNSNVHPDHAVALGAAVQAGLLAAGEGLEEIRITDVAPFTMGVAVGDYDNRGGYHTGLFSPIIQRNTPVPVSREQTYWNSSDDQTEVDLDVYQGEARLVKDNVQLGKLLVKFPKSKMHTMPIRVRFTYDSSGMLEVDALVEETGQTFNMVIADEEERKDEKAFEKRRKELAKLKFHPREEQANVALMARAERTFESHSGEVRDAVGRWILEFSAVVEGQDERKIAEAREGLTKALDQLDTSAPL